MIGINGRKELIGEIDLNRSDLEISRQSDEYLYLAATNCTILEDFFHAFTRNSEMVSFCVRDVDLQQ